MDDLLLVGDRVLVEPDSGEAQTHAGLYLPASVREGDRVGTGRVVAVGPGYLTANPEFSEAEAWVSERRPVRYLPLQARPGDHAFFLRKDGVDLTYRDRAYVILPHGALLALVREGAGRAADDDEDDDPYGR